MNIVDRLKPIIEDLKIKAQRLDNINADTPAHRYVSDRRLFSADLFSSYSDKYLPYVLETQAKLNTVNAMLQHNSHQLANDILHTVEQQINALTNALKANSEIHHEAQIKVDARKQHFAKKAAKKMMQSSHELYQTLAQYHEFERRLQEMINERMLNQGQSQQLNEEVLALHQRLGRCRKAISQVERQIELVEKPNS
ncbi:primosomal replication protein [Thalassotalea sp. LPB0316]|uniref:primosomal replication protein PriC n=1 Tax=Thalassotalea sp. LPB0316 TaxID=2769490 RepID=UPI001868CA96|nr:primosomal replication protein PriC [Thalassotalea sp. LPB0316]QOL27152.1 primosomal replication protein [Thalassotalea sp. LPB0316]